MVARRPRLGVDSRFAELVEGWLFALALPPVARAYRHADAFIEAPARLRRLPVFA